MINDRLPTMIHPSISLSRIAGFKFPADEEPVITYSSRYCGALQSSFNPSTDILLLDYRVAIPSPRALTLIVLVSSG